MDIEEIESILNCPICMEEYNDPRILPCQHSFCEKCLSSYIKDLTKAKPLKKGSFPCPICRHKTKLRNNCNDASSFERDLTKTGLLDSKHILLMQDEDSPADDSTCEAQTMSTQTDNGHDLTDLKDDPDFPTPALSGDDAKSENRKTPKRNRKRALARSAKNKDKNSSNTKKKRNKQKTNAKTDLNQGRSTELEFTDYLLVYFILIPLYTLSWKDLNKYSFLALFLVLILSVTVLGFTYMAPYMSVLFFCLWLFSSYKQSRELVLSHCNVAEVRQYQILFICHLQYSILLVVLISCLDMFVLAVSCKWTLSNALWKNDSIVSYQEFNHNFVTYGSSWVNSIQIVNVNIYLLMRYIVRLLIF